MPTRNPITDPVALPLVAPSILAADFSRLGAECQAVLDAGADLIHLDVMDGHFVPNLTMGPALCRSLRTALPEAAFDVHLMVTEPQHFVEPFAAAGASHLSFHIEAVPEPLPLVEKIHGAGMSAGLAINPSTSLSSVEPWLKHVELILVMSVHPGFAGQRFIEPVLVKARALRHRLRDDQRLEIDGGVNASNADACREAGCDVLVAASAIFGEDDYGQAIERLRGFSRVSRSA